MPDANDDQNNGQNQNNDQNNGQNNSSNQGNGGSDSGLQAKIDAAVRDQLAEIKKKLDAAYAQRDEAKAAADANAAKLRELERKSLEAEGKIVESYKLQVEDLTKKLEQLSSENTSLTRDAQLNAALKTLQFKSPRAQDLAYRELAENIVRSPEGKWTTRDGKSIEDAVKAFAEDATNSFLFVQKNSSGSGSGSTEGSSKTQPKKLSEMSQAEVLKLAQEGKLPVRR